MLSLGCRATIVSRSLVPLPHLPLSQWLRTKTDPRSQTARGNKTAQAAQELEKETGQRCLGLQADVRDSKALEEAVRRTVEEFGGIDFVVCGTLLLCNLIPGRVRLWLTLRRLAQVLLGTSSHPSKACRPTLLRRSST